MAAGSVLASRDMAAERRRTAGLDGAHHFELSKADVSPVGCAPAGAVLAKDIRKLQGGAGHERPG